MKIRTSSHSSILYGEPIDIEEITVRNMNRGAFWVSYSDGESSYVLYEAGQILRTESWKDTYPQSDLRQQLIFKRHIGIRPYEAWDKAQLLLEKTYV